jgi:hypothetical protein
VGANPVPNLEGCFVDSGTLIVPEFQMTLTYTYNPQSDNVLFRAFEGFSRLAQDFMAECAGNCPYPEFKKFHDYYGESDYGDNLISAAFDGTATSLLNGNMDFALLGDASRTGKTPNYNAVQLHCLWLVLMKLSLYTRRVYSEDNRYCKSLDVGNSANEFRD